MAVITQRRWAVLWPYGDLTIMDAKHTFLSTQMASKDWALGHTRVVRVTVTYDPDTALPQPKPRRPPSIAPGPSASP